MGPNRRLFVSGTFHAAPVLLAIFVIGISCGAALAYWPNTLCYVPAILVELLPLSGRFIYEGDQVHVVLGMIIAFFAVILIVMGRHMHTMNSETLESKFEISSLADSLRKGKEELEFRVEERTEELTKLNIRLVGEITERKDAERALELALQDLRRKTEEQALLLNTIDTQIWYLSDAETQGLLNRSRADFLGKRCEEIEGKRLDDFYSADVAAVCKAGNAEVFQSGRTIFTEEWFPNAAGEPRLMSITKTPKLDEHGNVEYVVCAGTDITVRKRTEEALRESEQKYRSIFENSPVGIFHTTISGKIIEVNSALARILRYDSPEDMVAKVNRTSIADAAYAKSEKRDGIVQEARSNSGQWLVTENQFRCKDGSVITGVLYVREIKSPSARVGMLEGFLEDITERKRYEEELLRIRAAVDGATDAISMATPEGEHFYQNRAFSDLFGYTVEDLKGFEGFSIAFKDHDTARVVFDKIRRGESWSGELEMLAKDGQCILGHTRANAIRDSQGSIMCLIGIHTDVTKLRAVEQALTDRNADLVESESRFKTLFDSASDGIFIKDRELRYTDVNEVMGPFFDRPLSDIIGKMDKDLFGRNIAINSQNVESRVIKGQTIQNQESLLYKSEPISVDCIRFPLRDSSHEIIGVCGIVREMVYCSQAPSDNLFPGDGYPSPAMRSTLSRARIAGETDSIILLTGESGSGKDRLARYIHDHSSRSHGPFYSVNCAAIPSELAESELFGHEAGAFTGAVRRKRGLMELAEGGTLLLNEIGELSYPLQGKLLQFLDTFSFTRVGGEKLVTVNIRLMAATNRDLSSEVCDGGFRKDLYYRLDVFSIHVPSLRERSEDIPMLIKEILSELEVSMGLLQIPAVNFEALRRLCRYSWPGNVRELRNVLERSLILSRGETIGVQHLVGMIETETADSLLDRAKVSESLAQ